MFGLVRFEGHILIKDCTQLVRLRIQVLRIFGPLRNGYLEQISPRKIPHAWVPGIAGPNLATSW